MDKQQLLKILKAEEDKYKLWAWRDLHITWNDDGKGNHIPADKMMVVYAARIQMVKEILSAW